MMLMKNPTTSTSNDNEALDDCGKVDLVALVFQNTDDNPIKYV